MIQYVVMVYPQQGAEAAEIEVPSADKPELLKMLFRIQLYVLYLLHELCLVSLKNFIFPIPLQQEVLCARNTQSDFYL